ncbi:MAG TPA: hypothetical protein VMA37_13765 [Acetobacteraceae bacterium]|nr:hypothetical protein [Acetobacteraceae bacterium]
MILRTIIPPGVLLGIPRAVIVHGLADACTALAPGLPLILLSAPGAALYAGAGWWQAMIELACGRFPETDATDLLDCADAPGRALEALRIGLRGIVLDPLCPAFPMLAESAARLGARLLPAAPPALDLARPEAARGLAAWLRQTSS